ncbi:MAG: Flp family type IVb pilin [Pseudomonadota bacterium]
MNKSNLLQALKAFSSDTKGATVVEYGLIATLLSLVVVGGIGLAFDAIEFLFADNNSEIQQALN